MTYSFAVPAAQRNAQRIEALIRIGVADFLQIPAFAAGSTIEEL
jgi:hypothetical protein